MHTIPPMNDLFRSLLAKGPDYARMMLFGLLKSCPDGDNPSQCQLHELRKMPYCDAVEIIKGMSDEECMERYEIHLRCLDCRLKQVDSKAG